MKLTSEQLRQMIMEEIKALNEVKSSGRVKYEPPRSDNRYVIDWKKGTLYGVNITRVTKNGKEISKKLIGENPIIKQGIKGAVAEDWKGAEYKQSDIVYVG